VGRMTLVDHDVVDTTNLQRQIAHTTDRVGLLKVDSLRQAIGNINPHVHVQAIAQKMTLPSLLALASQADVVLDCTDNFATRHAINQACVQHGKPLVSGAAMRFDGQLAVYHPAASVGAPCYACVFPLHQGANEAQCATMGVFAPLVGIVGSMQAAEALKLLVGMPSHLLGRLCMFNGLSLQTTTIGVAKQPDCKVCQVPRQSKDSC
jgi:molybdopterin-synthase adenylyltransferase